jgi:8-oxo-dGTP diphosphatase
MIDVYFKTAQQTAPLSTKPVPPLDLKEADLAKVLKTYWLMRSQVELKTIVIGLAIIVNQSNQVLIGARKKKDPHVEGLTWVFPGGVMDSLDFDKELQKEVKQETGLEVNVHSLIAARVHPDAGHKPVQIVALYFHCTPVDKRKPKAGGEIKEVKWVRPTKVFEYFTTSTCDAVTQFLTTIEKAS